MSRLVKSLLLSFLPVAVLTATAVAEKLDLRQVERVSLGASTTSHAIGSFADGAAVVLTTLTSGSGTKGFSLSKIVDGRPVKLSEFKAKPYAPKIKAYYIREPRVAVDQNDNIVVLYVMHISKDVDLDMSNAGTELHQAVFSKNGVLKHSRLIDRSNPYSYIETIKLDRLPGGNFLAAYTVLRKKVERFGRKYFVDDVHMAMFKSSGNDVSLKQVSIAEDQTPQDDIRLTGDRMVEGQGVAALPSGEFRIMWSHTRRRDDGRLYSSVAVADFDASGERQRIRYDDNDPGIVNISLSAFSREQDGYSDVVETFSLDEDAVLFYKSSATNKRTLVKKNVLGFGQSFWYSATQMADKYVVYAQHDEHNQCSLAYSNFGNGKVVRSFRITKSPSSSSCYSATFARMADDSLGALVRVSVPFGSETHFVRYRDR